MFEKHFIRQHDSMQCGAACLAMVCRYYGKRVSVAHLEDEMQICRLGVSLASMLKTAKSLGFESKAYKLSASELRDVPAPVILHWNRNHFVVLAKVSKNGGFWIADPANRCMKLSREEFEKHFKFEEQDGQARGVAMVLEPNSHFSKQPLGQEERKLPFSFLLRYLKPHAKYIIHIGAAIGLVSILQLILPFLTQWIVDIGIKKKDIGFVWLILLGELMILLGFTVSGYIRSWLMLHISARINIRLLSDFLNKLLRLPMRFFEIRPIGDIFQRMADHDRVQSFMTGQSINVVFAIVNFLIFGAVMLFYDYVIFLVFIAFSVVYGIWIACFIKKRRELDYELFDGQTENQNQTYQLISAMQEIKLQGCGEKKLKNWEKNQIALFNTGLKSFNLMQMRQVGAVLISESKNILITVLSASAVIKGDISLGQMMAIQYIIGQLQSPISQFIEYANVIQDVKISLDRMGDIHTREPERGQDSTLCNIKGQPNIELRSVYFGYDLKSRRYIINDISLNIESGTTTAIVGASGSGKSTLVKLMLGYYPALSGSITIGGVPIEEYNIDWWRKQCGVVMQDSQLFRESIACNIAASVDDKSIDLGKVKNAASLACIDDFIESLPLGYNTVLSQDGAGLSVGQRQRLLIARALYKSPQFIFLDEATNSLDATNEKNIVEHLYSFFRERTVVVVAHRLSTIRKADKIVVMDNGRIVEVGTHDSLVALKGYYYKLIQNQI